LGHPVVSKFIKTLVALAKSTNNETEGYRMNLWRYATIKQHPENANSKSLLYPETRVTPHHARSFPGQTTPTMPPTTGLPSPADRRNQPSRKLWVNYE